jgi:polygalacturonase
MKWQLRFAACVFFAVWAMAAKSTAQTTRPATYDVRAFGAAGDGKALDTAAIDKAIDAAASAGGGTVLFPAGDYLSVTIHLKSNVALYLDQGATIVAADPKEGHRYDNPEPNEKWEFYQDFGHTHWRNSLIWGENLQNVSILGPGTIYGKGLVRSGGASRPKSAQGDEKKTDAPKRPKGPFGYPSPGDTVEDGWGNKALALKLCRNVTVRDVTFRHGGHFAILATGVDNLTIDNVKIDTNRDGMDVDCCRNVRISNCTVNSPFDDGICLKSTHSLGFARACENVTITNCQVSGYDEGTYLDGTFKRDYKKYSHSSPTGRIKFGTESNGGFKNVTISNCVFDYCRGLALETVDGGLLEDVAISNITMRDIANAPIYLRLGARLRGPEGTVVGKLRRVTISNVIVHNAPRDQGVIIAGIPEHPVEDVVLDNVRIDYPGGGAAEMASAEFKNDVKAYPEPSSHGVTPAYGLFAQHVRGLEVRNFRTTVEKDDARSPIALDDVKGADFSNVSTAHAADVPVIRQKDVEDLTTHRVRGIADTAEAKVAQGKP